MQNAIFPMKYLNLTTGYDMMSHVGTFALDNAGKDSNQDDFFAPFDGTIKKVWTNGNTVWLQSDNKVKLANGKTDYLTVMTVHDNGISDLYVGKRIKQGQVYYREGTAGNAKGNHVHFEVGLGKFTGTGWHQNAQGIWTINNGIKIHEALFLRNTVVKNGMRYKWKTEPKENNDMPTEQEVKDFIKQWEGKTATAAQVTYYTKRRWTALANDVFRQIQINVSKATDSVKKAARL